MTLDTRVATDKQKALIRGKIDSSLDLSHLSISEASEIIKRYFKQRKKRGHKHRFRSSLKELDKERQRITLICKCGVMEIRIASASESQDGTIIAKIDRVARFDV